MAIFFLAALVSAGGMDSSYSAIHDSAQPEVAKMDEYPPHLSVSAPGRINGVDHAFLDGQKEGRLSTKRKVAVILWTSAAGTATGGYYCCSTNHDDISNASYGVALSTTVVGLVLWFLPE